MRAHRLVLPVAGAMTGLVVLAGCGGAATTSHGPAKATTIPTVTATPDPMAASETQVQQVVRRYFAVNNQVKQSATLAPTAMRPLLAPKLFATYRGEVRGTRAQGLRQTGDVTLAWTKALHVSVDKNGGTFASGEVRFCYDASKTNVVDRSGKDTQPTTGGVRQGTGTFQLQNTRWPSAAGWRIVNRDFTSGGTSCAAQ